MVEYPPMVPAEFMARMRTYVSSMFRRRQDVSQEDAFEILRGTAHRPRLADADVKPTTTQRADGHKESRAAIKEYPLVCQWILHICVLTLVDEQGFDWQPRTCFADNSYFAPLAVASSLPFGSKRFSCEKRNGGQPNHLPERQVAPTITSPAAAHAVGPAAGGGGLSQRPRQRRPRRPADDVDDQQHVC